MKSFFRPEREVLIPADNVTLALCTRADNDFIKAFEDAFYRVIPLGQTAKNPGRTATSMFYGYVNARGFEF